MSASRTLAYGTMKYYQGNQSGQTVGILPNPYYWWEAGALFAEMIEYWFYTGDTTYNDVVTQGLLAQVGPDNDYMPPNQTKTEVRCLAQDAACSRQKPDIWWTRWWGVILQPTLSRRASRAIGLALWKPILSAWGSLLANPTALGL